MLDGSEFLKNLISHAELISKTHEKVIFRFKTNLVRGNSHLNMYAFKYESLLVGTMKYLSLKYDKM